MASNVEFQRPDFSSNPESHDHAVSPVSPVTPMSPTHYYPASEQPTNTHTQDDASTRNEAEASPRRHESVATAVEDNPTMTRTDMDKIQTVPSQEKNESQDDSRNHHHLGLTETVKKAKRKIYLHHRNQKALDKQFTAGSAQEHMGMKKKNVPQDPEAQEEIPQNVSVWTNIWIMFTTFPYWNMAFWSGWCYSWGSALFILSSVFGWAPQAYPDSTFKGEEKYGVPLPFFFGAILYQIGGVMAYLEAVNDGCFAGAAMKRLLDGHAEIEKELLDAKLHTFFGHLVPHHHRDDDDEDHSRQISKSKSRTRSGPESQSNDLSNWESVTNQNSNPEDVYNEAKAKVERRGGVDQGPTEKQGEVREYLVWRWWPTWHSLWHYHLRELGYIATTVQLFGVTLFGVTAVVILPGIIDSLEWWQELWAYWIPQAVASCCFIIASIMFTIMAQDKWYKPMPGAVSWWIGVWALIGSIGFLMIACFGFHSNTHTWAAYQSDLSSIWGSTFYMISGLFQWYEAINVNVGPVLAFPNNRTPILLRSKKSPN